MGSTTMETIGPSRPSSSSRAEIPSPWTLSAVQQAAEANYPTQFHALPSVRGLTFLSLRIGHMICGESTTPNIITTMMLSVGHYDDGKKNPPVFAFIYGEDNNQIGYGYRPRGSSLMAFCLPHDRLPSINFEEPFCDLANGTRSKRAVISRLRAVILYYFLAAGHLQHIVRYNDFSLNFQRACTSVAKDSARPGLNSDLPTTGTQTVGQTSPRSEYREVSTPSMLFIGSHPLEGVQYDSNMSQKRKREMNEGDNTRIPAHSTRSRDVAPSPNASPSRKSAPSSSQATKSLNAPALCSADLERANERLKTILQASKLEATQLQQQIENLADQNAQLYTRCNTLDRDKKQFGAEREKFIAEIERLHLLRAYDANAYQGLEQKHKMLKAELANVAAQATNAGVAVNRLQNEVMELKNREEASREEATMAKRTGESSTAALKQLKTEVAKDMAIMAKNITVMANEAATRASNDANKFASKYGSFLKN